MRFTFDEIVKSMTDLDIPREVAERQARRECGIPEPQRGYSVAAETVPLVFPVRLTLPWSALCSDNYHEKASLSRLASGELVPRKVLDARYKLARDKARDIAKGVTADAVPVSEPLGIVARVFVPDERPHDVCNFAKCCHDALEKVVYTNDRWLYSTHWERAGVDVDAPRAEIEISLWAPR